MRSWSTWPVEAREWSASRAGTLRPGRGGEEAVACQRAGVAVEVVPGITSAVSVPAAAGIPVTHRGLSRGFSVITAHADLGVLPQRRDHTLILLMGVSRLRDSVTSLLEAGSRSGHSGGGHRAPAYHPTSA